MNQNDSCARKTVARGPPVTRAGRLLRAVLLLGCTALTLIPVAGATGAAAPTASAAKAGAAKAAAIKDVQTINLLIRLGPHRLGAEDKAIRGGARQPINCGDSDWGFPLALKF